MSIITKTSLLLLLVLLQLLALSITATAVSAQQQGGAMIEATYCEVPRMCVKGAKSGCKTRQVPSGTCVTNHFEGRDILVECTKTQDICVNASQYADTGCSFEMAGLSGTCTQCTQNKMKVLCGGLAPGNFFIESDCQQNMSNCGNCKRTIVPQGDCKKIPGFMGAVMITNLVPCPPNLVKVTNYPLGSSCQGAFSNQYLASGDCFLNERLRCL